MIGMEWLAPYYGTMGAKFRIIAKETLIKPPVRPEPVEG
jgi:hypothetical protein